MQGLQKALLGAAVMTDKLSERIASGENTPELREAIAVLAGWYMKATVDGWFSGFGTWHEYLPDYLTDIRLTLADIERREWDSDHLTNQAENKCYFTIWSNAKYPAIRTDRDLDRCACEALVKALENDDGK
jgi:hypothetical protein